MPEAVLNAEEAPAGFAVSDRSAPLESTNAGPRAWRRTAVGWLAAAAIYWFVMFAGTHTAQPDLPVRIWGYDKLLHAGAYLVLPTLLLIAWRRTGATPGRRGRLVVAAIALAYGAIDELTQPYFERSCEFADWLADLAGVTAAITLDSWRHRRR